MHPSRRVSPFILAAALLVTACTVPLFATFIAPSVGVLQVDIQYSGTWYRDTFHYARDAANIRHVVLVMPGSESPRVSAGRVFSRLAFPPDSATGDEHAWALDHLYDAPWGYFTGEFEPGIYALAAAFLAKPLSRAEAGVGDDVTLWPGVTGGGASTDYQTIEIKAGETTRITIPMDDSNGWACPWVYVSNGQTFERRTEILRNLRGNDQERTESTPIGPVTNVDGSIVIKVTEEKDEVSYIDSLYLVIDGVAIAAQAEPAVAARIAADDGDYLILHRGQSYELRFPVPTSWRDQQPASVVVTGYYTAGE